MASASSTLRPPPLTQSDAATSLLSLGLPATGIDDPAPIPISSATSTSSTSTFNGALGVLQDASTVSTLGSSSLITPTSAPINSAGSGKHHRRLGSTGKTRRRLSDAREASTRPLTQHSLLSLASLSLSTSPGALTSKPLAPRPSSQSTTGPSGISISRNSTTPIAALATSSPSLSETTLKPESSSDKDNDGFNKASSGGSTPISITTNGKQKKRGVDYKCESCAKLYRHPNCLNKHRWEHTRQWREASKFVLSKHQQVQLLEAAAILSYMGTSSTSLPEDRSEWPSFLSGGSLPKVDHVGSSKDKEVKLASSSVASHYNGGTTDSMMTQPTRSNPLPLSTSVPVRMSANGGHGPRMHHFTVPASSGADVGIGVVGPGSGPIAQARSSETPSRGVNSIGRSSSGRPFMRPLTPPLADTRNNISSGLSSMMMLDQPGWTSHIPSSSIRSENSASGSGSRSRSGSLSGSRSRSRSDGSELEIDEEGDAADVDVEIMDAEADMVEDENVEKAFGVRDSMAGSTMKGYPISSRPGEAVPFHVNLGVAQRSGTYSSSSYGTANASSGTPGSFGGIANRIYAHRNGTYPKPTERHGGNADRFSTSRSALRSIGSISQREEDEERMSMRGTIVKSEVEENNTSMKAMNDSYERRWDGMEMEVDMDMD